MLTARLHNLQWLSPEGLHKLAYREWGDPDNPHVLLCVHGLTRTSADFLTLAHSLAKNLRVVAADMPGRGGSDWLSNSALYTVPTYVNACEALVAQIKPGILDWLGTSMGGLIGMSYASLPHTSVRKLILNDVGPCLNLTALERIGSYIGKTIEFSTLNEARKHIRTIAKPFGPHTQEQWKLLTDSVLVEKNGRWTAHYDPAIGLAFQNISESTLASYEEALWAAYDAIESETLIIRGEYSDLLSQKTVAEMLQRGPKSRVQEVAGVGHAPTFMQNDQIQMVRDFLF